MFAPHRPLGVPPTSESDQWEIIPDQNPDQGRSSLAIITCYTIAKKCFAKRSLRCALQLKI